MMLVGPEKGGILRAAVDDARRRLDRPLRCCELGTYVGYGAVLIGAALADGDGLLTVDVDPSASAWARRLIARAGLDDRVYVRTADASMLARLIDALNWPQIDVLFVDHDKARYLDDLRAILPVLAPGAVVVADNVHCFDAGASMRAYLDYVRDPRGPFLSSTFHSAFVEYSFQTEPDAVEVSVLRS